MRTGRALLLRGCEERGVLVGVAVDEVAVEVDADDTERACCTRRELVHDVERQLSPADELSAQIVIHVRGGDPGIELNRTCLNAELDGGVGFFVDSPAAQID